MNPVPFTVSVQLRACLLLVLLVLQGTSTTLLAQFSGVYREVYSPVVGGTISALTNLASFPNSPNSSNLLSTFDVLPRDTGDQYGQRVRALVRAPTNGIYTFWINSDDQGALYLGTNDTAAGLRLIAVERASSSATNWDSRSEERRVGKECCR